MPDFFDQPQDVQPGQLSPDYFVNRVLHDAASHCETVIDTLPHLLAHGRISESTAHQADRLLTALAELFREPLRAQGAAIPKPIR